MSLCTVSDDFQKYFKIIGTGKETGPGTMMYRGITTTYATKFLNPDIPRDVTVTRYSGLAGSLSKRLYMLRDLNHIRLPKVYGCMTYDYATHVVSDSWESMTDHKIVFTLTDALAFTGRKSLSVVERRMIVKQLIDGIEYIHSLNYVHRNLSPDTILVTGRNGDIAIQITVLDYMCHSDECPDDSPIGALRFRYALPELQRVLLKRTGLAWQKLVLRLSDLWGFGQMVIDLLAGYSDLHIFEMYGLFELADIINGDQEWHHRVTAENIKARIGRDPTYRPETEWSLVQRPEDDGEWQLVDDNVVLDVLDPFIGQQPDDDWQRV